MIFLFLNLHLILFFFFFHFINGMLDPPVDDSLDLSDKYIAKIIPYTPPVTIKDIFIDKKVSPLSFYEAFIESTESFNTIPVGDSTFITFTKKNGMDPGLFDGLDMIYVEKDQVSTIASTTIPWGLNRIDQIDLPLSIDIPFEYPFKGTGVNVYVIDSGIRETHKEINGRVIARKSFAIGFEDSTDDLIGHGTHVSGTISGITTGVAKNVNIINVRAFNGSGKTSNSIIMSSIRWAVNHAGSKPSVISMSLGSNKQQAVDDIAKAASDAGHIVVVAAGNSFDDACNYSPASSGGNASKSYGVITVGATDNKDNCAVYSNYGKCVDLFAPGTNIFSSWNTSDYEYKTISGTSMATPHVSGVAAVLLQKHNFNKRAAMDELFSTLAKDKIIDPKGSPNLLLQLRTTTFGICVENTCTDTFSENTMGIKITRSINQTYQLVNETTDLCDIHSIHEEYINRVVLVNRGNCSLAKKALIAKHSGAKLIIVPMKYPDRRPKPIKVKSAAIPILLVTRNFGTILRTFLHKPISFQTFDQRFKTIIQT